MKPNDSDCKCTTITLLVFIQVFYYFFSSRGSLHHFVCAITQTLSKVIWSKVHWRENYIVHEIRVGGSSSSSSSSWLKSKQMTSCVCFFSENKCRKLIEFIFKTTHSYYYTRWLQPYFKFIGVPHIEFFPYLYLPERLAVSNWLFPDGRLKPLLNLIIKELK